MMRELKNENKANINDLIEDNKASINTLKEENKVSRIESKESITSLDEKVKIIGENNKDKTQKILEKQEENEKKH